MVLQVQVRRGVLFVREPVVPSGGAVVRVLPVQRVEPRVVSAGPAESRAGAADEGKHIFCVMIIHPV